MIKPRHSRIHYWIMDFYIRRILHRDFHDVQVVGDVSTAERPVLLIPNHISWWDGFFAWHINRTVLHKKFHIMMLEKELAPRRFFSRVGAFSINRSGKGTVESLNFAAELLHDNKNLVVFFPQGRIESMFQNPVTFEKGIERVLENAPNAAIVFCSTLIDYSKFRKPTVRFYLRLYNGDTKLQSIQDAYNQHLAESIRQQIKLGTI